ncbi:MAG TPA: 4-hydroxy-3-methylbut-2-enyl diphosphate reductase [Chloroflexia bacterium]|nr:4-hydroxy-3-methylbut-2-enyl diphosphate reductase [Chloroflexia bacterium]
MEIKLAKEMGMCFGVRDTLKFIDEAGQSRQRIDTLGTLVHNPQLVERLSKRGVEVVGGLDSVSAPTVAVTAHGAAPDVYRRAELSGLELLDTTCPLVTRVQQLAKRLMEEGNWVIVYGDAPHPEVIGILGWANSVFEERGAGAEAHDGVEGGTPSNDTPSPHGMSESGIKPKSKISKFGARRAICAKSVEEIEAALIADGTPAAKIRRIALISQTTQNTEWFKEFVRDVVSRFLEHGTEVHAHNTVCLPTAKRQPAAVDLAKEVDVMVVVGGYESANTRHLRDIAAEFCPAYHIERPEQLEEAWFQGVKTVGVTAGASTPDYVIKEVVDALEDMGGKLAVGA